MELKIFRQMLEALADDTRLRIVNIIKNGELSVSEICDVLDCQQSNISKHLTRLRLSGLVNDRRDGLNVFYSIAKPKHKVHKKLLATITVEFSENEVFVSDSEKMYEILKKDESIKEEP